MTTPASPVHRIRRATPATPTTAPARPGPTADGPGGPRPWAPFAWVLAACVLLAGCASAGGLRAQARSRSVPHRSYHEVELREVGDLGNPFRETEVQVTFVRPDGTEVAVDAFYDGDRTYRARAYCDTVGAWSWRSRSNRPALSGRQGRFQVIPSSLPGKLRVHPRDPRQLAYDDGRWFLHLGDTAYRYVVDTEPDWQAYIDQAAQAGFNKIRVWFARHRHFVDALHTEDRQGINVPYWQEMERRLLYALERYPHIIFQLIPYAEDAPEMRRYGQGDPMSVLMGRYAQARFSALPNVTWVISNDLTITVPGQPPAGEWRDVDLEAIDRAGRDFKTREPWGTLIANHQARFTGYHFVDAPWSDLIILEDLDQVDGALVLDYRNRREQPVFLEEDRYEWHRSPGAPRYFFRRLMWATLLSGAHPTYGGNRMFEPLQGDPAQDRLRGVRGYYDLVRTGVLSSGAHDFLRIRQFFADSGVETVGLEPDDALVGNDPRRAKCLHDDRTYVVYLANPSGDDPRTDVPGWDAPIVRLTLPEGRYGVRWFDPVAGAWHDGQPLDGGPVELTAPATEYLPAGDWVLLLERK